LVTRKVTQFNAIQHVGWGRRAFCVSTLVARP
jgi:hypothetical protein